MSTEFRLVPFDEKNPAPAETLAQLHTELLPRSPVQKLGRRFMEQFYYVDPVREGAFFGAVAYVGDRPAGFVVATSDSVGFMGGVLRRHFAKIGSIIAISTLASPKRIASIWEGFRIMTTRSPIERGANEGEILSMGVMPEFTGPKFIRERKLYIARDLLGFAVARLKQENVRLVRAIVDLDNTPAMLFYHGQNWSLENENVPGWIHPSGEFVLRLKNSTVNSSSPDLESAATTPSA